MNFQISDYLDDQISDNFAFQIQKQLKKNEK